MGVWWLLTAHVHSLLALCVVWRGGTRKTKWLCARVDTKHVNWDHGGSQSRCICLNRVQVLQKTSGGGVQEKQSGRVRNKTRTLRSWSQSRCCCLNKKFQPKKKKTKQENHLQNRTQRDSALRATRIALDHHGDRIRICRPSSRINNTVVS